MIIKKSIAGNSNTLDRSERVGGWLMVIVVILILMRIIIIEGSALPADPKIWKFIKNVKMYFGQNMLFLKVSGQMVSIAVFSVFFYIG